MKKIYRRLISLIIFNLISQIKGDELLSDFKPTKQSTSLSINYEAYLAVDGRTSRYFRDRSCSNTKIEKHPWWQVDLLKLARITQVQIFDVKTNRKTIWKEFEVWVSNNDDDRSFIKCGTAFKGRDSPIYVNCFPEIAVRFVQIRPLRTKKIPPEAKKHLALCEVGVYGYWINKNGELLSDGMPASQSSTYNNRIDKFQAVASLAVDGINKQQWSEKSCSLTNRTIQPWWQVDLEGGLARVKDVSVYTRKESSGRLGAFKLLVSNFTREQFSECASWPQTAANGQIINLECDAVGRFVRIQLSSNTKQYLSLCEVKVYGYWISKDKPLSDGLPVSQSTTLYDIYKLYHIASVAVDGNINPTWWNNSCAATLTGRGDHWWQMYLTGVAHIRMVIIYSYLHYADGLTRFNVLVSNNTEDGFSSCVVGPPVTRKAEIQYLKCNAIARILQIRLFNNTNRQLILCEVKVYGKWIDRDELLSEGMPASQSSTMPASQNPRSINYKIYGSASLAVDGDTKQKYRMGSCSCTEQTVKPWWQVNLVKGLANITLVSAYPEGDTFYPGLNEFKLLVSNSTNQPFSECGDWNQSAYNRAMVNLECNAVARIVRIQIIKNIYTHLSLCEVKVYGKWIGD